MMVTILENKMDIHAVERHMESQREMNNRLVTDYEDHMFFANRRDNKLKPGVQKKTYIDGSSYIGFLANDKRKGPGIYYYANGDRYFGEWESDKFHGDGNYVFANGERYTGCLRDGLKEGYGERCSCWSVPARCCR